MIGKLTKEKNIPELPENPEFFKKTAGKDIK